MFVFVRFLFWFGLFFSWKVKWTCYTKKQIVLESRWEIHASRASMISSLLSLQDWTSILNKDEGASLENTINMKGIPRAMGCCVLGTCKKNAPNDPRGQRWGCRSCCAGLKPKSS